MSFNILSFATQTVHKALDEFQTQPLPYQWNSLNIAVVCTAIYILVRWLRARVRTTPLTGPVSESFLYGVGKFIRNATDMGALYEKWAQKYGPAYAVPSTLGTQRIVLYDPKAIAHFHAKETWVYIQTPATKKSFAKFYGKGLLWAHGEDHQRQRKSLTPAFSIAAIRQLTPIFYDSAHKAKSAWDASIQSSNEDGALIEVQKWMNHISLDIIGLAAYSHDFGALDGKQSTVTEVLDTFSASPRSSALNKGLLLLSQVFPILAEVPTSRTRLMQKLNVAMEEISDKLLARTKKELDVGVAGGKEEKSIIGLLIKGARGDSAFHLTKEEVMAQMKVLLVAGYETTSIVLTWALLELSRDPDVQTKLRNELLEHGTDPTYDELTNALPYLDAVVHEVLRIHMPIIEITRVAIQDDVIPLSEPIRTKTGKLVDRLTIAKGTLVAVNMDSVNRAVAVWGEDAKAFRPSRWLKDVHGQNTIPAKVREIQGYRHLLSFADGPRSCIGKNFAVAELKAVLAVLVKNFVFELRDGLHTKIEIGRGVFPRPKIAGEVGCKLPLRVRPYFVSEGTEETRETVDEADLSPS